MKCPKCGYISFDYNQVCPKCNKDISGEQAKTGFPSFRPDPPSLLGILIGEADESNVGLHIDHASAMGISQEMDMGMDDSAIIDSSDMDFEEDQDLEISFDDEGSKDFELPQDSVIPSDEGLDEIDMGEDVAVSFDEDESAIEDSEALMPTSEGEGDEDISMDLGDLSLDEPGMDISAPEETDSEIEEGIDLEGLSLDDGAAIEEIADEDSLDLTEEPEIDLVSALEGMDEGKAGSEIELDLDDLSINETGELEIGAFKDSSDLSLDGNTSEDSEATTLLEDLPLDELPLDLDTGDEDDVLDLGDLALDEPGLEGGEEDFDLDGISLDDEAHEDDEKTIVFNESPAMGDAALEDMMSDEPTSDNEDGLDLEGLSLDINGVEESDDADDELTLDLENLDLDLDLDDTEDK